MNKICTSLEQSKKLIDLGIDRTTADMYWSHVVADTMVVYEPRVITLMPHAIESIPAWSLDALLDRLDAEITDNDGNFYDLTILKEGSQYKLYYHDKWYEAGDIETDWYDDMIDACVEMIVKLKEKGLI